MQATPVLNILGLLLGLLAGTMLIPMGIDLYYGDPNWQAFGGGALMTGFIGGSLWLANRQMNTGDLGLKEAFLLTNGAWVFIALFGALPLYFSSLSLSVVDAVFCFILTVLGGIPLVGRLLDMWLPLPVR